MSEHGGKTYRPWEPERYQQQAHSPASKLPEGDLVFFLLDTVPQLDLSRCYAPYEQETRGAPPFDPAMMVCLLLYAYCVGVFSSRKLALACERNLAFMAIVGEERPDFRTISDFRKLHLEAFKDVFVQVVRLAGEAGLVKLGNVSTDGTKIQGNASRHKAMSYGYMKKEVARLREDIEALVTQASQQDAADDAALGSRRGDELPEELARREKRLATIESAMRRLEEQAKLEAEEERQHRAEAERQRQGHKRRGPAPKEVDETPADKAQSNFTDPELHIMRTNNKGWDYCGNAQASVDGAWQIIVACDVTDDANDKKQAEPMAQATLAILAQAGIERPKDADTGAPRAIAATLDNGYYSEAAAAALEGLGFDPYIAAGRLRHHEEPQAGAPESPRTAKERMAAKVRTEQGRELYSRRKAIVEPVFGQVKEARGFRRFLLRGLEAIRGEWRLVCLTHNLLKLWRYGRVPAAV